MQNIDTRKSLSQVYLSLVPVWTFALAMAVGHISYKIYLPIWIINVVLMVLSAWVLGLHVVRDPDKEKTHIAAGAFCLLVPLVLTSLFFGLGPPPESVAGWVATITEQQIRFIILIIAGVFFALGFAVLRDKLKDTAGSFYSVIGFTVISIAIPLFIVNMIWWSAYLPTLFQLIAASGLPKSPEWFHPVRDEFNLLTPVEIALFYLGLAAFAASLWKGRLFRKTPSLIYIVICFVAIIITAFPYGAQLLPIPFFIVTIPAAPFCMAYYMGINILRKMNSNGT
jgi:hypothetical protein